MEADDIVVELGGIRVTSSAIAELDEDGTPLVAVAREEIVSLSLAHGYVTERLLAVFVLGAGLVLVGVALGGTLVHSLATTEVMVGRRVAYLLAAFASACVLGAWLVRRALQRGPFVAVALRSDRRKLGFRGNVSADATAQFARTLQKSAVWSSLVR